MNITEYDRYKFSFEKYTCTRFIFLGKIHPEEIEIFEKYNNSGESFAKRVLGVRNIKS